MPAYIELPIDGTDTIMVELPSDEAEGLVRAGRLGDTFDRAQERLDEAVARLKQLGANVLGQVRDSAKPPTMVQVEVGLKLTAQTGFVVAQSTGEAHFIVRLEWSDRQRPDAPAP